MENPNNLGFGKESCSGDEFSECRFAGRFHMGTFLYLANFKELVTPLNR